MGAMGICISSSIHPSMIKGATVVNKDSCVDVEISAETDLSFSSPDTSNCAQYSEDVSHSQETRRKPEDDLVDNMLNNAVDWSSEDEHSNEQQKQVQRKEGEVTSMDISDEDFSEEEEFLWIPATLASHMGLKSCQIYPGSEDKPQPPRDRIYANEEDLFMSVEVGGTRRSSRLVTIRPHRRICPDQSKPDKTNSVMTVQNTFVNNNAIDLISLGRN